MTEMLSEMPLVNSTKIEVVQKGTEKNHAK